MGAVRGWRPSRTVIAVVLAVLLVLGGLGWAAAEPLALANDGRLLPETRIDGVDVGGLEPSVAVAAITAARAPDLDETIVLRWPGGSVAVSLRELGTAVDAAGAVTVAMSEKAALPWTELAQIRWGGPDLVRESSATLHHDAAAVESLLRLRVAREVVRRPTNASLDWSSGRLRVRVARRGQQLELAPSTEAVLAALRSGEREAQLPVRTLEPAVTSDDLGQTLYVDQRAFRLTLYEGARLVKSWPVAIGAPRYPTPTGDYEVTEKRYLPTWINPAPDGWGRNMPLVIGPGARNPLGLRALNWSAPGAIRFHGTADLGSIGRRASKGCVRLANADVIELFDLVDVGARIISVPHP